MKYEARKDRPLDEAIGDDDAPLPLEPDTDTETAAHTFNQNWRENLTRQLGDAGERGEHAPRSANNETSIDEHDFDGVDQSLTGNEASHMSDILRWALDSIHEPAMASADWLARDIDPEQPTVIALLTNPKITLAQVTQAKSVFKTMRIVGEKSADRRIGARMYAAAIAAGLVRHGQLITRQSEAALKRGFQGLLDDHRMPGPLRDLAGMAMCALGERRYTRDENEASGAHQPQRAAPANGKPAGRAPGRGGRNGSRSGRNGRR